MAASKRVARLARTVLLSARELLVALREFLFTAGPFVALGLALLVLAYLLLDPAPPRRVSLATGPEQSAYAEFGRRYAAELKRDGIEVALRPTAGSLENLQLLRAPQGGVDLAFVQGGADELAATGVEERDDGTLHSLGSMFYEPVWLFYRVEPAKRLNRDAQLTQFTQLRDWRVSVGVEGSGAPGLINKLLHANLMEADAIRALHYDHTAATVALLEGTIDALVFVSAPESPLVQTLLQTPGIRTFEFQQAEAYARRYRYLSPVTLPRGVADLSRDVPPRDLQLIASTTSVVTRAGTHPAVIQLFVQAAQRIHGGPGWIARAGQFPSPQATEFALTREAERYFRSGPPLLQRHLPFWLANLIDRMWVALVSIIAVLIPLSRVVPPLYRFRIRSRVFRWYRQLRLIEDALSARTRPHQELLAALEDVERRAAGIVVPLSYADELYALRRHIELVRLRLQQAQ